MTAICGLISHVGREELERRCAVMLAGQRYYGPHDSGFEAGDGVALGRALYRLTPEDDYDQQPLTGAGGRFRLVADARIDNREELIESLGLPEQGRRLSDASLLLACYERWELDLVDRLVGDFAFAVWDDRDRKLSLARDPLGQRPLHYRQTPDAFLFSTMPSGILSLDHAEHRADGERVSEFLSELRPSLDRSFFADVSAVQPGHVAVFSGGQLRSRRYWEPRPKLLELTSWDAYVEAFRAQIDQAVRACLRGAGSTVAAHLSSGYDSSTVAATAARLLRGQGGRVVAITSAPRLGFDGLASGGRLVDESGIAAITAGLHPNMDHVVVRSDGLSPVAAMIDEMPSAQQPISTIRNAGWWTQASDVAARHGASVLLTGENGNMTISAGGLEQLAELIRNRRLRDWWREIRAVKRNQPVRWRGVLAASFGPWLPRAGWELLTRLIWHESAQGGTPFLLTPEWQARINRRPTDDVWSSRPSADSRAMRFALLKRQSNGNSRKASLGRWGIDERDPTSDRRLIDFCFSLPPALLLKNGIRRPLARAALADRLPAEVLDSPIRGYQSADWYERIRKEEVLAVFRSVEGCGAASSVIDMDRLGAMLENWPVKDWHLPYVFNDYTTALNALSSAYFIQQVSRGRAFPV